MPDHDRPLNGRGRASADALGDWLRDHDLVPDQILCSTAERTQETARRLQFETPVTLIAGLYHAGPDRMLATLRAATGQTVLLLGHNPGIAECAQMLVASRPAHPRFWDYPTGATLIAQLDGDWTAAAPGGAVATDFVIPRDIIEKAG